MSVKLTDHAKFRFSERRLHAVEFNNTRVTHMALHSIRSGTTLLREEAAKRIDGFISSNKGRDIFYRTDGTFGEDGVWVMLMTPSKTQVAITYLAKGDSLSDGEFLTLLLAELA